MKRTLLSTFGLVCLSFSYAKASDGIPSGGSRPNGAAQSNARRDTNKTFQSSLQKLALSFEPNFGQADTATRFISHGVGYTLSLQTGGARFRLRTRQGETPSEVGMELAGANQSPVITGEDGLPGKANYFPQSDKSTWITDIPTYSRVHYKEVYPGVDLAFYGAANRLEYDFILEPGADASRIRMNISGSERMTLDDSGDLVLPLKSDENIRFLRPSVYQISKDGKRRDTISASYRLAITKDARIVTFALGKYDHHRQLVIDPVVALSFSEYLPGGFVGGLGMDSSGNTYVTGSGYNTGEGVYVTKFNSSGAMVYTATIGTGSSCWPYSIAVGSTGEAYVTGSFWNGSSFPTSTNAYQSTVTAYTNGFLFVLSAAGSAVPYATYLGGADYGDTFPQALAVDSSGNAYLTGFTQSATFPTTSGAYQTTLSPSYDGFVSKFNPAATAGAASLVYSTLLGPGNTYLNGIAIDSSGDAYVTGNAPAGFPVTSGAFQYTGVYSGDGGVYVTKLNPTGTALLYSAYLGYGSGAGIAVDASTSAYVTGTVSGADFPTTAGAYQTSYAGAFLTKLNSTGASEVYSTFLGGPSSYSGDNGIQPSSIALPYGCSSSCNAYVAGWTNTTDFPVIDAFQTSPSVTGESGFVTEIAATGASALLSSYLNGADSGIYPPQFGGPAYGTSGATPSIAVDSSGDIYVAANIYGNSDFPITLPNSNSPTAFLAKIVPASTAVIFASPTAINFSSQPVGVSTSIYNGALTVRLYNFSSTAATLQAIQVSPSSIFSESDNCGGSIAGGGYCTLTLNFTPNAPGARTGTVTITSNASNSPTIITLSGTGYDTAFVEPSTNSLTFGNQAVGTSSSPQSVTITNLGDETTPLNISTNTSDFLMLNNCPPQLQPGASCTATVTFTPTQPGLRTDNLDIYGSSGPGASVSLSGTGTVSGGASTVTLSSTSLQFAPQTVGATSMSQYFSVTNTGTVPVVIQSVTVAGDFAFSDSCGSLPYQLTPEASCGIYVTFTPTASGARTGTLTITDSASGSPQTVALSGAGVAASQNVEFYPSSAISFPDTPVGSTSGNQLIYLYNTGSSPVTVDRVTISGPFSIVNTNCEATTVGGITAPGTGGGYCYVYVSFTPTATGAQTGSLTFTDSAPNSPQVVNLSGNGITATGSLALESNSLTFTSQPIGVTSAPQSVYYNDPGDTPVTVNSFSFSGSAAGDYSVDYSNCNPPYQLSAGQTGCYVAIQFTPTASGTRSATLTIASSAGNQTVALTGSGVAATQAIGFTPTSLNLGPIVVGQNGPYEPIYVRNIGNEAVTFSANPAITGANPGDFTTYAYGGCATSGYSLAPGTSCQFSVYFAPSATGTRSATLTFTDSAGTQPLALSGTGVSTTPTISLSDYVASFDLQVQGTTSPPDTIYLYNNGTSSISMGAAAVTGPFVISNNECSGQTLTSGAACYVQVEFAPTASGYQTGVLTFRNNGGAALSGVPTVPLAGYAPLATYTATISPTNVNFTAQQVVGTTSASYQTITLNNTGDTPLTVGTITGTNFGSPGASTEFSTANSTGGYDNCSGQTVAAGSSCSIGITFTPNATGAQTGTVSFPVTYSNSTTATLTASLSGTGVTEKDSAVLTPPNASFIDQVVNTTSSAINVALNNTGNQPLTVGTLTNTKPSEFSTASSAGGNDYCSGQIVQPGSYCYINVTFTPTSTGAQTGSITFPITYADHTTATLTLSLSGNGVASGKTIQITPAAIQFGPQLQGVTSYAQGINVTNTGNLNITIGTDAITTNSAEFAISSDSCSGTNLTPNAGCTIYITFTPSATATGSQTGTLKIADNATGGPHTVSLTGTAIPASQQIVVSQTTLAFGSQPAGSTSSAQVVYFTNQSDSGVSINSVNLSGTNAADFQIANNTCGYLNARSSCYVAVQFVPPSTATGAVTASLVETDSASPGTHTVSLTGTVVAPGPAAALNPTTLTFSTQNVGTTSAVQYFSVTNTGSANLTISAVTSTNSAEFPISTDGCSGVVLTPSQNCVVGIKFSPAAGGSRTGSIKVTDNAPGSPQSVSVSGTGYGIPSVSLTPSSLTFGNTNIGSTSATQAIIVKNTGSDTLAISSIALAGANTGDFAQTNTCPASLAPSGTCTITVSFTPTASGTRGASVVVTDNANNAAGSTQIASLTGTGVAAPTAAAAPTSLTFSSTNIGTTSAAQTVTLTNSGTGPLTISSIAIGGTNPGDFAQTNNCGATLVASSNCTISVTFAPSASGARSASLTITDNANNTSGATQTVTLSGTGAGVPSASVSPNVLPFSDTNVGVASAVQAVTLTNSGSGPLSISSIAISGANPGDFSQTNTCGSSLASGSNCTISVTFKPTAPGSRAATLTITDNANNVSGATQTVALSGTGIGVPVAGVSTSSLVFPSTNLGATSSAQTVTLTNSGTGPLTIDSIVIGAANPGDFAQTNNCGTGLAAGASCTISVTFTPTAAGSRTAALHVLDNSNNTGSSQTVTLSGTGVAIPVAGVAPSSLTFSSQTTGTTSAAQVVMLTNTGNGPLSISGIAIGGTNAADFAQTNTCGTSLAASASCSISVTFTPAAVGSASATLTITDNSGNVAGSTQTVNLSGTGAAAGPPTVVSLTPSSGTGLTQTFSAVYSDPNGLPNLTQVTILFNSSLSVSNACGVTYTPSNNTMYLYNNAGTGVSTGVTPGSSSSVSNSQCTLNGAGSSVTTSGNNLTLNAAITFNSAFTGQKNVYLYAAGKTANSGYVLKGTWLPASAGPPTLVSLTPSSGTGLTQTFSAVYSDPNTVGDLSETILLFNTSVSLANACAIVYAPSTNLLYLYNNAGTTLTGGFAPGSSGSISNSQCTLTGTGSSVSVSGDNLTVNAAVTFSGTFTGLKDSIMYALGKTANSGWKVEGTWTP